MRRGYLVIPHIIQQRPISLVQEHEYLVAGREVDQARLYRIDIVLNVEIGELIVRQNRDNTHTPQLLCEFTRMSIKS